MKKLSILFFAFLATFLFTACNSNDEAVSVKEDNSSFEELKKVSNKTYTLKTIDAKEITLKIENEQLTSKQLEGKFVLINFWATWCPPCIKEMPTLNKIYEKYNNKFEIVGVLFEKNKDEKQLREFISKHEIKFPITVGDENFRMAKAFNDIKKIPESFLYSKDGKFIKKFIGEIGEKELEKYLSK